MLKQDTMKYFTSFLIFSVIVSLHCRKIETDACGNKLVSVIENFNVFHNTAGAYHFRAKFAIDADGSPRAYHPNDLGLDALEHAKNGSQWVGIVVDNQGNPVIQKATDPYPGYYVSQTSLFDERFPITDPLRYVNAEKVPYIVLPPQLSALTGAQIGDFAYVYNTQSKIGSFAIFADEGPDELLGEGSIFLAKQIGIVNDSPRNGGLTDAVIQYIIFPKSGKGNGKHRTNAEIEKEGKALLQKIGGGANVLSCF
jgi:hypothetical protein